MPFIISGLASLSTFIGSIPILFKYKNINKILNLSLSFAGAIMIGMSLFDLIPESINILGTNFESILHILIFINIGFIISNLIDRNIHIDNKLYRVGIMNIIAIIIHNIPEGIITYVVSSNNIKLGITLAISVALHNIPEGIAIALPIYYSKKSRGNALLYTFISGISELFGSILGFIFFKNVSFIPYLFLIISGIMIHISLFELLPQAMSYKEIKTTLVGIILGISLIALNIYLLK